MEKSINILLFYEKEDKIKRIKNELESTEFKLFINHADNINDIKTVIFEIQPDVIVSDYQLTNFSVIDIIDNIRNSKPIPIIILSNPIGEENVVEAIKKGASDFILFNNIFKLRWSIVRVIDELEIINKKKIELDDLRLINNELEARVIERTSLLEEANIRLYQQIEEKRKIEEELFASKLFFNKILDSVELIITVKDPLTLDYLYVNDKYEKLIGLNRDEIINKNCIEVLNNEEADFIQEEDKKFIISGKLYQNHLHSIQFHGSRTLLSLNRYIIKDEEGNAKYLLNISEDITKKDEREKELVRSSLKFSKLFQINPNPILIVNFRDLIIEDANNSFLDLMGLKINEVIDFRLDAIPIWYNVEDFKTVIEQILISSSIRNNEINLKTKSMGIITALLSVDKIITEDDNYLIFQAVDITDRKNYANEILRSLEKEKDLNILKTRFISMISHEFRTPLTTIMLSTDLLKRYSDQWDSIEKIKHYDRIQNTVLRMTQLMENVLTIGRLEAGKFDLQAESIDLYSFSKSLAENVEFTYSNKNPINFKFIGDVTDFKMDENLMALVITNLLTNAVKYSPKGKPIDFTVVCNESRIIFQIKDYGIGIPETEIDKVFNTFFRASNVGSASGYGLGLSIVQKCVEAHLGTIEVEAKENEGTKFIVEIPVIGVE